MKLISAGCSKNFNFFFLKNVETGSTFGIFEHDKNRIRLGWSVFFVGKRVPLKQQTMKRRQPRGNNTLEGKFDEEVGDLT